MVTKGQIESIDYAGNTCKVRLPLLETVTSDKIVGTAIISNTPGSYNGYKENDVVLVAFENDKLDKPVIIGKLYLGQDTESKDPRGTVNCVDSVATKSAKIPADTKLTSTLDNNMPNTLMPYNSLTTVTGAITNTNASLGLFKKETSNEFKSVIGMIDESGKEFESKIEQASKKIKAEVKETYVPQNSKPASKSFGWSLMSDNWTVFSTDSTLTFDEAKTTAILDIKHVSTFDKDGNETTKKYLFINGENTWFETTKTDPESYRSKLDKNSYNYWKIDDYNTTIPVITKVILRADDNGLKVNGTIEASDGHIGKFVIGDEHDCSELSKEGEQTKKASGIYSADYISAFEEKTESKTGVYVGTDGIKLGNKFSVDTTGDVEAANMNITGGAISLGNDTFKVSNDGTMKLKGTLEISKAKAEDDAEFGGNIEAKVVHVTEEMTSKELSSDSITATTISLNANNEKKQVFNMTIIGARQTSTLYATIKKDNNNKITISQYMDSSHSTLGYVEYPVTWSYQYTFKVSSSPQITVHKTITIRSKESSATTEAISGLISCSLDKYSQTFETAEDNTQYLEVSQPVYTKKNILMTDPSQVLNFKTGKIIFSATSGNYSLTYPVKNLGFNANLKSIDSIQLTPIIYENGDGVCTATVLCDTVSIKDGGQFSFKVNWSGTVLPRGVYYSVWASLESETTSISINTDTTNSSDNSSDDSAEQIDESSIKNSTDLTE